jgi:hypothetical protein
MPTYLAIKIDSATKTNPFVVTGPFDIEYGFTNFQDQKGFTLSSTTQHAADGVQLRELDDGNVEFRVSIKELRFVNYFTIKFRQVDPAKADPAKPAKVDSAKVDPAKVYPTEYRVRADLDVKYHITITEHIPDYSKLHDRS